MSSRHERLLLRWWCIALSLWRTDITRSRKKDIETWREYLVWQDLQNYLKKTTLCCSIYLMLWQSTHFDITWWCRNRSPKSMNHLIGKCVTSSRQLLKKKRHRTGKDYHNVCWFTSASIRRYLGLDQSTDRASPERWSRWLITSTLVERRTTTNRRLSDVPNLVI